MRPVGFSTGAIARANFQYALSLLRDLNLHVVELSALRYNELEPLFAALPGLELSDFDFVSIHAPSAIPAAAEKSVVSRLAAIAEFGYPVIVHPDTISDIEMWRRLGHKLVLENMDKRKPVGRTVADLQGIFDELPAARFCFDIGHARQVDPSMTQASLLIQAFVDRLEQIHLSEVNTASRHDPISLNAVTAFQTVARYIPEHIPIILETLIDQGQSDVATEIARARASLPVLSLIGAA